MIYKLSEAFVDILHGSLQRKWRFDVIGISYCVRGLLSIILFSIGLYLFNNLLASFVLMSVFTYLFIILFDLKFYKKEYSKIGNTKKIYIFKLLIQCIPLVLYGLLFSYVAMYPRVMAEQIYGSQLIGYYASVATPALIIQVASSFVFSPLISLFAELFNEKKFNEFNKNVWKILLIIILFGLTGVIGAKFLSKFILGLLFGRDIIPYAYLFGGVIIISTFTAIIWFLGMILTVIKKYGALLFGAILSLILTLIISKYLIVKMNLMGINIILLISYFIQIVVYLIAVMFLKKDNDDNFDICYIRSTSIINDSRASKEITSLINNGFKVTVLGWDRDKSIFDYKNVYVNNNKLNISFFKFRSKYGESFKNVVGLFLFQFWLLFKLIINNKKYKSIHACDFDCGLVSLIITLFFNKKMVYDMYDYYSDSRQMPLKVEKIINKLENSIINNADVSIICGEWRKEQIKNAKPKQLLIIHNTPEITNIQKKKIIKSNTKKLKIVYVGILQDYRLLLEIIDLIKDSDKFELHIGGFGKHEEYIKKVAKQYKNIVFYGSLNYNDVLCLERDCDILFATYDPKIKNHKYSAPNKIYEAMALGKPIIVCKGTGIDELIIKNNIGFSIEYNANSFMKILNKIFNDKNIIAEMGVRAKKIYKEKYNWGKMEKELINVYNNILEKTEE